MLRRIERQDPKNMARVAIEDAEFPSPFYAGLEFSSPARGTWNIVHTGMLIPQAHEIFVCAKGCLRGVVLTAAEANALDRYSAVEIREDNVLNGNMEELMIEGVSDVLEKLDYKPRAVLLFISCQHFFLAYDQGLVFETLRQRFPDIYFTDCYMIPTLRKSGLTPDQKMRIQMYSMLEPRALDAKKVNFIGSNIPPSTSCELRKMLADQGMEFKSVNDCGDFDEYLDMASARTNLYFEPLAAMAAEDLEKRLGQQKIYMPFVFQEERLEASYEILADKLGIDKPDFTKEREKAKAAMKRAREVIGDAPVVVDYTFTFRILSFARFLLEEGFQVTKVYADGFVPEEEEDFRWIQTNFPKLQIVATTKPSMRYDHEEATEKTLAIGQKAAYFEGTDYFLEVAEGGGLFGYDGIGQIGESMAESFGKKKDRRTIIQRKGYGCESCL